MSSTGQPNGTIYLKKDHATYDYNTSEWDNWNDIFITVGISNRTAYDALLSCQTQYAVIGATIFNYMVWAPGEPSTKNGWPLAIQFKVSKLDSDPGDANG
jgi:hypothetical protein